MSDNAEIWAGQFGDEYVTRSPGDPKSNKEFFRKALSSCEWFTVFGKPVFDSVIEFGAGAGNNLRALADLMPYSRRTAVEVNPVAAGQCAAWAAQTYLDSLLDWKQPTQHALAFTKGVLIHISPEDLPRAYEVLYRASRRYILIAEYFAPVLTEIEYRGRSGLLWKGPHAYDMLDAYQDLKLLDYGFASSRDPYPQDNLNWWVLEKVA